MRWTSKKNSGLGSFGWASRPGARRIGQADGGLGPTETVLGTGETCTIMVLIVVSPLFPIMGSKKVNYFARLNTKLTQNGGE